MEFYVDSSSRTHFSRWLDKDSKNPEIKVIVENVDSYNNFNSTPSWTKDFTNNPVKKKYVFDKFLLNDEQINKVSKMSDTELEKTTDTIMTVVNRLYGDEFALDLGLTIDGSCHTSLNVLPSDISNLIYLEDMGLKHWEMSAYFQYDSYIYNYIFGLTERYGIGELKQEMQKNLSNGYKTTKSTRLGEITLTHNYTKVCNQNSTNKVLECRKNEESYKKTKRKLKIQSFSNSQQINRKQWKSLYINGSFQTGKTEKKSKKTNTLLMKGILQQNQKKKKFNKNLHFIQDSSKEDEKIIRAKQRNVLSNTSGRSLQDGENVTRNYKKSQNLIENVQNTKCNSGNFYNKYKNVIVPESFHKTDKSLMNNSSANVYSRVLNFRCCDTSCFSINGTSNNEIFKLQKQIKGNSNITSTSTYLHLKRILSCINVPKEIILSPTFINQTNSTLYLPFSNTSNLKTIPIDHLSVSTNLMQYSNTAKNFNMDLTENDYIHRDTRVAQNSIEILSKTVRNDFFMKDKSIEQTISEKRISFSFNKEKSKIMEVQLKTQIEEKTKKEVKITEELTENNNIVQHNYRQTNVMKHKKNMITAINSVNGFKTKLVPTFPTRQVCIKRNTVGEKKKSIEKESCKNKNLNCKVAGQKHYESEENIKRNSSSNIIRKNIKSMYKLVKSEVGSDSITRPPKLILKGRLSNVKESDFFKGYKCNKVNIENFAMENAKNKTYYKPLEHKKTFEIKSGENVFYQTRLKNALFAMNPTSKHRIKEVDDSKEVIPCLPNTNKSKIGNSLLRRRLSLQPLTAKGIISTTTHKSVMSEGMHFHKENNQVWDKQEISFNQRGIKRKLTEKNENSNNHKRNNSFFSSETNQFNNCKIVDCQNQTKRLTKRDSSTLEKSSPIKERSNENEINQCKSKKIRRSNKQYKQIWAKSPKNTEVENFNTERNTSNDNEGPLKEINQNSNGYSVNNLLTKKTNVVNDKKREDHSVSFSGKFSIITEHDETKFKAVNASVGLVNGVINIQKNEDSSINDGINAKTAYINPETTKLRKIINTNSLNLEVKSKRKENQDKTTDSRIASAKVKNTSCTQERSTLKVATEPLENKNKENVFLKYNSSRKKTNNSETLKKKRNLTIEINKHGDFKYKVGERTSEIEKKITFSQNRPRGNLFSNIATTHLPMKDKCYTENLNNNDSNSKTVTMNEEKIKDNIERSLLINSRAFHRKDSDISKNPENLQNKENQNIKEMPQEKNYATQVSNESKEQSTILRGKQTTEVKSEENKVKKFTDMKSKYFDNSIQLRRKEEIKNDARDISNQNQAKNRFKTATCLG